LEFWLAAAIPTDPPRRRKIDRRLSLLLHCGDGRCDGFEFILIKPDESTH
jgi:hypothetical protein